MNAQSGSNSPTLPGPPGNGSGIIWRAWPCKACCRGVTPIGFLLRCAAASRAIHEVIQTPEQIAGVQIDQLNRWISNCSHTPWRNLTVPKIAEGSEHAVFFDDESASVWKATLPNVFGDSYSVVDGRIHQRNDSPLDYLMRLRLWRRVFRSAPEALGLSTIGQIISRHRFIVGEIPSQMQVDAFLSDAGFRPVNQRFWIWRKVESDAEIWIGDARDENFVLTPSGIVPIDLRIWSIPLSDV